jgi:hypothetical protein
MFFFARVREVERGTSSAVAYLRHIWHYISNANVADGRLDFERAALAAEKVDVRCVHHVLEKLVILVIIRDLMQIPRWREFEIVRPSIGEWKYYPISGEREGSRDAADKIHIERYRST